MKLFRQLCLGAGLFATCLMSYAMNRIELDGYGGPAPGVYAPGVPWRVAYTQVITETNDPFYVWRPDEGNSDEMNGVVVNDISSGAMVLLSSGPGAAPLDVGAYRDASYYFAGLSGHPGMLLGLGSGDMAFNMTDGSFDIYELKRNQQGDITALAASFLFYYGSPTGLPLIGGRVWINSEASIPSSVPEPGMLVLTAAGAVVVLRRFKAQRHNA